ncbi:MAG: EAL domain-containing protein [Lachnospiraceae bacterium]|nr:EAL domain-containing protein [Lachnospiraceae bacterium]
MRLSYQNCIYMSALDNRHKIKGVNLTFYTIGVGSEFKSLAYWDQFEFDYIMFEPNYIKRTLATPRGRQILITLLSMGRQLKMQVIADGITTRDDVIFLCSYGCNAISGAYYSNPICKKDYLEYISDKRVVEDEQIEFAFINNFISKDEKYSGEVIGDGILFAPGISENWGSILFPGGFFLENVLKFPGSILSESWTVCFWINPTNITSWTSAFYAKYQSHYATFSPYVEGGCCIFRISDGTVHGWHDMLARAFQPDNSWHFICMTYDEHSGISRAYIDGINAGILTDLPSLPSCQNIYFGGDSFQPSYEGYLSGVIFFNQPKSDEEITELYEQFKREPGFAG